MDNEVSEFSVIQFAKNNISTTKRKDSLYET